MKYKYILWDWNGTLLDDLTASLYAVNDMLKMYEKNEIDIEEYYSYIDTPIYKFYEKIFDLNVVTMDIIKPLFGELYEKNSGLVKLADGANKVLEFCSENKVKQYIISAAHIDDLLRYANKFNVTHYFEKIDAATDYDAGSKIERAKKLIEEQKIDKNTCVMIGDTLHDLDTAIALGVECILYSKGHTEEKILEKSGKKVCSSFEEILETIM